MPGEVQIHGLHGLRATIAEDGAVHDRLGAIVGYINEDGAAGDATEKFIGEVNQDGMVLDSKDEIVGYADFGRGTLKDKSGSHFATVQRDGTILDTHESQRGCLKNFTYHKMKIFASYVFFFDSKLIGDKLPTSLKTLDGDGVDATPIQGGFSAEEDSTNKEEARLLKHMKGGASKLHAPPPASAPTQQHKTTPVAAPPPQQQPTPAVSKPLPQASSTSNMTTVVAAQVPPSTSSHEDSLDEHGLVSSAEEKARKEAERMNRLMGGMSVAAEIKKAPSTISQHDLMASKYPVPTRPEVKSNYEVELWQEINKARQFPMQVIQTLEAMRSHFNGTDYKYPGTHTTRPTREGVAAVDEAVNFLKRQTPITPLVLSDGLSHSCKDFVALAASSNGDMNNIETDEQGNARFGKYGKWSGQLFQNIALGNLSPYDVVINWIIDDGNSNRDHRQSLFNSGISFVGIASGPNLQFNRCTVACFTSKYIEGSPSSSSSNGVPLAFGHLTDASAQADDGIPTVSTESEYKVGPLTDSGNSYFLDVTNLGCPASALQVQLLDNGKLISFKRTIRVNGTVKEAVHKMKLPFNLNQSQLTASFVESKGMLTLTIAKPGTESGSTTAQTFGEFKVPAWPTNTNEKVSVQATSSSEAYTFVCEPSKHETNVVVSIDADRQLTFEMEYTFDTTVDGTPATKTIRMTSSFALPFNVSSSQVSIQPNGDKGSSVKVFKSPPSANHSQADVTIAISAQ